MRERFVSVSLQPGAQTDERRFVWHCDGVCKRALVRYAQVDIEEESLCIKTIRSDTLEAVDTYTIYKTK